MEYLVIYSDELFHHGILGQKWGVRRFQNQDGSVTPAGARRYYDGVGLFNKKARLENKSSRLERRAAKLEARNQKNIQRLRAKSQEAQEKSKNAPTELSKEQKTKALKIAAGVAGAAAVTVGAAIVAKKLNDRRIADQAMSALERASQARNKDFENTMRYVSSMKEMGFSVNSIEYRKTKFDFLTDKEAAIVSKYYRMK